MKYSKGMIIKMTGLSVKKENGVFEINSTWEKDCSVYKLKKDGTRIKSKYALNIFKYTKMDQFGEVITLDQVSAAITEINEQLKERKSNEIVVSYESTNTTSYENKSYIRVIKPIQTTKSIYAVPTKSVYQLSVNEKWNSVTWYQVGKKGELLSNYNGENMMTWGDKSMVQLFEEGYIEIVERVETVRKDIEQTEEETPEIEVSEAIEATKEVIETVNESVQVEEVQETVSTENEVIETQSENTIVETDEITFQTGTGSKGNGIEITFTSKPSEEVRNALKANGYRWAGKSRSSVWWAIMNDSTLAIAEQLAGKQEENNIPPEPVEYPEINIDDNHTYVISQKIQDAEHAANWIFRSNQRDHNKELQEILISYTDKVKNVIALTDNPYYIYKLKSGLQRFKKNYHETYVKWLSAKASQPSWAVTGRGNLNVSRYNKAMSRQDALLTELVNIPKELDKYINKYRNKIKHDQETIFKQAIEQTEINIDFKIETKEFSYMGYQEKKRVHVYKEYFIVKLWGCFRLFRNGKELNINLKTTDNLQTAKKALIHFIKQSEQIAS